MMGRIEGSVGGIVMTLVAPVETFTARTRSPFWTGIVSIYPACYLRLLVEIVPCWAGSWAETLKNYPLPSRCVQIFCANHSSQQSALTVDFQSFNHQIHLIVLDFNFVGHNATHFAIGFGVKSGFKIPKTFSEILPIAMGKSDSVFTRSRYRIGG